MSWRLRMPPPTENGMNTSRATPRTISMSMPRPSAEARDVVEDEFVDALAIIFGTHRDGIAQVAIFLELDALGDLPVADIEADDHALGKHQGLQREKFLRISRPWTPLFSAWNCVATTLSRASIDAKPRSP